MVVFGGRSTFRAIREFSRVEIFTVDENITAKLNLYLKNPSYSAWKEWVLSQYIPGSAVFFIQLFSIRWSLENLFLRLSIIDNFIVLIKTILR